MITLNSDPFNLNNKELLEYIDLCLNNNKWRETERLLINNLLKDKFLIDETSMKGN